MKTTKKTATKKTAAHRPLPKAVERLLATPSFAQAQEAIDSQHDGPAVEAARDAFKLATLTYVGLRYGMGAVELSHRTLLLLAAFTLAKESKSLANMMAELDASDGWPKEEDEPAAKPKAKAKARR